MFAKFSLSPVCHVNWDRFSGSMKVIYSWATPLHTALVTGVDSFFYFRKTGSDNPSKRWQSNTKSKWDNLEHPLNFLGALPENF